MKALTIWQPWASAIALGAKRIETRTWSTRHRGPLLIHAARTPVAFALMERNPMLWREALSIADSTPLLDAFKALPFGSLVARAELVDCVDASLVTRCAKHGVPIGELELELGDYAEGRFGLLLANVERLRDPIPFRGRQGMFTVPASVLENEAVPLAEAIR